MRAAVRKKITIAGLIFSGVVLVSIFGIRHWLTANSRGDQLTPQGSAVSSTSDRGEHNLKNSIEEHRSGAATNKAGVSIEDQLVAEFKKYYGKTITNIHTQVGLLKVKKYLSQLYPQDGPEKFYSALKRAFPDLADDIMLVLAKMERYQDWLEDNAHRLSQLNPAEKEGLIWEQRNAIFGEDAKEIWSEEIIAFEQKKQDVRETISYLDEATDMTIYEKLDVYQSSLKDAYDGSTEEFVLDNKGLLAKVFLSIGSVQDELKQLDPERRQQEINNIRRELGFTQQQVEYLEGRDTRRDQRWENGLAYMEERELLEQNLEGPELESELAALRKEYFKHEANTIALEEKDGFFRYRRPRIYGRN